MKPGYLCPPGYKQTEVGVIPEEWNVACVGDSFNVCNQLRLPISQSVRERMAGPYPYYGPTSVQGWINEYRVEGEYALIGEDGDHFLKWRSQPMTLLVRGKFNVNNHAHLLRGTKNLTEWFYWFFANRDMTPYLTRQGAGRYKLTKAALIQIPCALPPPPEQRAIAGALSDVDALIGSLDQLIAKKRDLKQAAMQELLTGKKRLPGFSGEWKIVAAGSIGRFRGGSGFPTVYQGCQSGDYPFFKVSDMNNEGNETFMETANNYIAEPDRKRLGANAFPPNTIVFAKVGAAVFLERKKLLTMHSCIDNNMAGYVLDGDGQVDYRYIHYFLLNFRLGSLVSTTALPSLSGSVLRAIQIPLPPTKDEQSAIAEVLSDMDAELAALEQRRDKTRALKQGMMQELLTGRTRLV